MEEIKVGEYVRTNEGYIAKMKHYGINKGINGKSCLFDNQIRDISVSVYDQDNFLFDDELDKYIVKHSPNIIDLIEVGDYVNGYRVKETGIYTEKEIVEIYAVCNNLKEIENKLINKKWYVLENLDLLPGRNCKNDSIKSIGTKEQFESIEYKL